MDQELKQYLEAMENRINGRVEKSEIALRSEFHKWASPVDLRARTHAAVLRVLDLEMEG